MPIARSLSPRRLPSDHQSSFLRTGIAPPENSNMNGSGATVVVTNEDMQAQLEQSMQRSVTLVFWHKPNSDPIRLHHTVPTFPYFQLSTFSSLASDLGLSPTSYIDSYNPNTGRWEQSMVTTVRVVETEQRLLYRARKSLLEGLNEDECLDLKEELAMQPRPRQSIHAQTIPKRMSICTSNPTMKRSASDLPDMPPVNKYYIIDGHQTRLSAFGSPTSPSYPQSLSTPIGSPISPHSALRQSPPLPQSSSSSSSPNQPPSPTYIYFNPIKHSPTDPPTPVHPHGNSPRGATGPIPYHPHPPLKRWPNDYTVSEIVVGFRMMDSLIAQTPTVVQRTAFERVFGCRYVKSTVCRHRGVWRKAEPELVERFVAMGAAETAVWGEFVRQVEGRPAGKTKPSQNQSIGPGLAPASARPRSVRRSPEREQRTPQKQERQKEEEERAARVDEEEEEVTKGVVANSMNRSSSSPADPQAPSDTPAAAPVPSPNVSNGQINALPGNWPTP